MATLSETRERIRFIITDALGPVLTDRTGDLLLDTMGGRMTVAVRPFAETHVVDVACVVGRRLEPSAELLEYVARNADAFMIGHLGVLPSGEGPAVTVVLAHRLLAEGLDPEHLLRVISVVSASGEEIAVDIRRDVGRELQGDGDAPA